MLRFTNDDWRFIFIFNFGKSFVLKQEFRSSFFFIFFGTHARMHRVRTFYRNFHLAEQSTAHICTHTHTHQSSRMKLLTHALHVPHYWIWLRKLGMIPIWMCIRCDTTFTQFCRQTISSGFFFSFTTNNFSPFDWLCQPQMFIWQLLLFFSFSFWSTKNLFCMLENEASLTYWCEDSIHCIGFIKEFALDRRVCCVESHVLCRMWLWNELKRLKRPTLTQLRLHIVMLRANSPDFSTVRVYFIVCFGIGRFAF